MSQKKNPRILIVTPEITYLPEGMGNLAGRMSAKAGGMADVSASLVASLFDLGADVHVALPHYRRMFHVETGQLVAEELRKYKTHLSDERIHLAEDRCFYYRDRNIDEIAVAEIFEDQVDELTKQMEENHITRLDRGACTPNAGAQYLSLASDAERVADHFMNMANATRYFA